jgi:putative ABC transport system permease protein
VNFLLRTGAIFIIALKRLFAQRRLALLTALGLTVAVALTLSVPLYADAVYGRTLNQTLLDKAQPTDLRPPFAFMFRQIASTGRFAPWENVLAANAYFAEQAVADLGLPPRQVVRFYKTDFLSLFPSGVDSSYLTIRNRLAYVGVGVSSDVAKHITLKEGHFPAIASGRLSDPIEVLTSNDFATKLGIQVGETYLLFDNQRGPGRTSVQILVRIAGVWEPNDERDEYWFYKPWALSEVFLVPEETFASQIVPSLANPIYTVLWYLVLDGSGVRPGDAQPLLNRMTAVLQQATQYLPGVLLEVSPAKALLEYESAANLLTIQLFAFSVPIIGLILAFISLVVGLTVGQQRNEIAVLRSRGGTTFQVIGMAALEALALNALALTLGWPLSQAFAGTIGRARSFLNFSDTSAIQIVTSPSILRFGLAMAGLALVIQMIPTLGAARHTIITYKQERARTLRPPWWQRAWLDVLLLLPTAYGIYVLRKQGAIIALPLVETPLPNDPFQNPLLFLIPSLGVFALTLVILRILPPLMRAITWLAAHTRSVGLLLAARHLARVPGTYAAPLLLLVLTLSLSAFTASLATTLDDHLYDRSYYQFGADMFVDELGQSNPEANQRISESANQHSGGSAVEAGPRWLFLPVSEHLKAPGVEAASRVGRYAVAALLPGGGEMGTFIGLDRADFPAVAYWRRDFAPASLGALMNALATAPEGVLATRATMAAAGLKIGDTVRLQPYDYQGKGEIAFRIVGELDLFPTWYPSDGPLFVGNLDYYFEQVGGEVPYDVWLKTGANHNYTQIAQGIEALDLNIVRWEAPLLKIAEEQRRPERQGLFGLLSVGFLAAALLTVLGFLLYALFSFRRRTIELGILRAVGLSAGQMTFFLAWELIFLILTGLVAGTGLGAWISGLFIPYLQVGTEAAARIPPFLVEIAWPAIFRIYALFGLLFVVALVVLAVLLLRMKIYQAIKLGETV